MKKVLVITFSLVATIAIAQQDSKELQETARNFMNTGDYPNAILVLQKAIQIDKKDFELQKDLAMAYYLNRDFANGKEIIKKIIENPEADVQCYQLAGNIYKAMEEIKDCERIYKKGLKLFPNSGALYNEYGELLWGKGNSEAIVQWEKGIETAPGYSGNYYNAARYYFLTTDKVWALIYGEIFVNIESYSPRTAEIKTLLLDAYKKFFANDAALSPKNSKNKDNEFVKAFSDNLNKNIAVIKNGITPQSLIMLRTRFILDWFEKDAARFPNQLFEHQRQLLQQGMYEAYNQWLFGAADNLAYYENWIKTHPTEYEQFSKLQRNKLFKFPQGQYYQKFN